MPQSIESKEVFEDRVAEEFRKIGLKFTLGELFEKMNKLKEFWDEKKYPADEIIKMFIQIMLATENAISVTAEIMDDSECLTCCTKTFVEKSKILQTMKENRY